MKILIGTGNEKRLDRFAIRGDVTIVSSFETFAVKIQEHFDFIWLHCDLFPTVFPWDWMGEVRKTNPNARVSIVLCDKVYDSILLDCICRLAADFQFSVLPLGLTDEELIAQLEELLYGRSGTPDHRQGKLLTILSATSKDGATTIATNLALALAKQPLNIGVLDLNFWSPDIKDHLNLMSSHGKNLLSLRPRCLPNILTSQELIQHCVQQKGMENVHFLLGSNRRDTAIDVTIEEIKVLIDVAKETFDIVIADVHSFPNNAATVYAVRHADERWVVAQPVFPSYRSSWGDWFECYWRHSGLKKEDFSLVLNRADSVKVKKQKIEATMGAKCIAEVANVAGGKGLFAVNEGVPLLVQEPESQFAKDMSVLVDHLLSKWGIHQETAVVPVQKPSLVKKWFKFS